MKPKCVTLNVNSNFGTRFRKKKIHQGRKNSNAKLRRWKFKVWILEKLPENSEKFRRYTGCIKSFASLSHSPHVVTLWWGNCVRMLLTVFRVRDGTFHSLRWCSSVVLVHRLVHLVQSFTFTKERKRMVELLN